MFRDAVFVHANEHDIVEFLVLVDFVLVREVRNYLRIYESLFRQIRENSSHIRVRFGQLKRLYNRLW